MKHTKYNLFTKILNVILVFGFILSAYTNAEEQANKDTQVKKIIRRVNTEEDALQIAKEYLVTINKAAQYYEFRYITQLKNRIWYVVFLKREGQKEFGKVKSIKIKISQKTGEVIESKEQDGFFVDKEFG